jgi:serine/threonine protein kinase
MADDKGAIASGSASSSSGSLPKNVGPKDFSKLKLLGRGDVGKVYLVKRQNTDELYAMKVLTKAEMLKRNKVFSCSRVVFFFLVYVAFGILFSFLLLLLSFFFFLLI